MSRSTTRIAINGFGRIGRSFFRAAFGLSEFEIVAVNDLTSTENLAYLLQYDSVYGKYKKSVIAGDRRLEIDGTPVTVYAEKGPERLPWKDLNIDIVVESTGFFASDVASHAHLESGAKRVVITAPANGENVTTALIGTNDDRFAKAHPITCNASCTTNSVAPVLAILDEAYGITQASMITVHGYTASQRLVDGPDPKDFRRGRAAAANIVPTSTGAADAVTKALPKLEGKFSANALRVPVITGSFSVMTVALQRSSSIVELQKLFRERAAEPRWSPVLAVTEDPVVSSDIVGEPYGAIVDLRMCAVTGGTLANVFSWYDNEAGYTATLVEHVRKVAEFL